MLNLKLAKLTVIRRAAAWPRYHRRKGSHGGCLDASGDGGRRKQYRIVASARDALKTDHLAVSYRNHRSMGFSRENWLRHR